MNRLAIVQVSLACFISACSGGGESSPPATEEPEVCDGHTDLTRGTIDGPACDMDYDVVGKSDQIDGFHICTEYLFESTLAEPGECDRENLLGYCVSVDERDSSLVRLIYGYADPASSLGHCDQLVGKSYQCLNRAENTWCNAQ
jgi:hypothetical protein